MRPAWVLLFAGLWACTPPDDETGETGAPTDTGDTSETADTSETGETGDTGDTGPTVPLAGFGDIAGTCGELDEAMASSSPALLRASIDFGSVAYKPGLLTDEGQEVIADGNLGGSSLESEAIAMDLLVRCELAELLATEAEIAYVDAGGKKTDLLVSVDATGLGVSVTRAFHFPPEEPYTEAEARTLLENKLEDVLASSANAAPSNAWARSALAVVAYDEQYADMVVAAWGALDPSVRDSTIVLLTETHGEDAFIY